MATFSSTAEDLPLLPANLVGNLREALAMTDRVAFHNVTHDNDGNSILDTEGKPIKGKFPRGGPFGAALAISSADGKLEIVGKPRGNNVVGSGIASQHAEDRALQGDNYAKLRTRLEEFRAAKLEATVWMLSSGQSCPNCHTKEEIMARRLIDDELIKPGRFVTLYGATFDETFQIAQFYDAQYADAMILFSRNPRDPGNLVKHDAVNLGDAPLDVQATLKNAQASTALITRDGNIYSYKDDEAVGRDARTVLDLFPTAEVSAVQKACLLSRAEGEFASWQVKGELWTTSSQIGPLLLAEMGWTRINTVHTVKMPTERAAKQFETRETSIPNTAFQRIVAGGYQDPGAAIRVLRDETYQNTAQPKWAEVLKTNNEVLYNGAAVSAEVLSMRDRFTRYRFAAEDVCNHAIGEDQRPVQPLRSLKDFKPFGVDYTG